MNNKWEYWIYKNMMRYKIIWIEIDQFYP